MPVLPDYTELDPGPRHSAQDSYQVPSMPRNPIPDALEGMGQALMRGGTDYAREQRYWARQDAAQNRQDIAQAKFDANSTYEDFKAKQIDALNQAAQNAPAGAPNFTQNFLQQYDAAGKDMWKGVSQAPDQVLAPLNSRVMKDREWFAKQAQAYEAKQGRAFYVGKINDFTTNILAGISHDSTPENFGDSVKRVEEQINALPSYFTPDDKMKFDSMARVQLLKGYAMAHPDQFQGQMENFANSPFGQKLMQQLPEYRPGGAAPVPGQNGTATGTDVGQPSAPASTMPESAVSFFQERYAGTRQGHFNVDPNFGGRLQNALNDAEQATGGLSTVLSLRRTNAEQRSAYRNYMMGGGIAAKPGHSLHEIGDAADLRQDVVWQWLRSRDPKTGQPRAANYGLEFLPDRLNDKGHIQLMKQFRGGGTAVMPASAPANVAPSQAEAPAAASGGPGQIASGPLPAATVHPQDMTIDDLWPRLVQRESQGDQSAVSSKGAIGVAQVMPDTAPEAARLAGVPFDEAKYKTDPAYNEQLGRAYLGKQLDDFGGDATKALAAYNAGPQKTRDAIAKYGPNWLSHMPAETQNYVRKLAGIQEADSGQIVNDATANTPITPDSGAPEIFHGITPKDLFQIQNDVRQEQAKRAVEIKGQFDLGIETGKITNRNQILASGLPPADQAALLRQLDAKLKETGSAVDVANALTAGSYIDATDPQMKKGINAAFNMMAGDPSKPGSGVQALAKGDPRAMQVLSYLWGNTNALMPDDAKAALQSMIRSGDSQRTVSGLAFLSTLQQQNPMQFQATFGDDTVNKVAWFNDHRATMSPADVAAQIKQQYSPEFQKTWKPAYDTALEDARKKYDVNAVTGLFDRSGFMHWRSGLAYTDVPQAPSTVLDTKGQVLGNPMSMVLDFQRFYAEASANGMADPETAAMKNLQKTWGPSPLNGNVVMKYPPENYYPDPGWMRGNLDNTMRQLGYVEQQPGHSMGRAGGIPPQTIVRPYTLLPVPGVTEAQIRTGQPPQYMIMVQRPDGSFDAATDPNGKTIVWPARSDLATQHRKEVSGADAVNRHELLRLNAMQNLQNTDTGQPDAPLLEPEPVH